MLWCPRVRIGSGVSHYPRPLLLCPTLHCARCHSIVGSGWCLCGRFVSLWNGGEGLCVCWNSGGGVVRVVFLPCFFLFSLPLLPLLPLRVGVRGSARAALRARTLSPNTAVFSLVALSLPLASRLSSRLRLSSAVEWRWGFTMCWSIVLA